MKVHVIKEVDLDTEIEVDLYDVLRTVSEKLAGSPHDQLCALDSITKIIERLPVECLDHIKDEQKRFDAKMLARERLKAWKDCLFATDEDVRAATNLLCKTALEGLPPFYRLSLVVEDGETDIRLRDVIDHEDIHHGDMDECDWLEAIDAAREHHEQTEGDA